MARYYITSEPEPIDFEIGDDIIVRTIQNCKNLLMTRMGEVPYDRFRGFDPQVLHRVASGFEDALLPELDRLMEYEPDAEVVEASARIDANGDTVITMVVEIEIEE